MACHKFSWSSTGSSSRSIGYLDGQTVYEDDFPDRLIAKLNGIFADYDMQFRNMQTQLTYFSERSAIRDPLTLAELSAFKENLAQLQQLVQAGTAAVTLAARELQNT